MTNPYSSLRSTWVNTAAAGSLLPSIALPPLLTALNAKVTLFEGAQDGVTDDTAAIQNALNAMGPNGILWIPRSTNGTKVLGFSGASGVVSLYAGQAIWSNGEQIITGAGPAFSRDVTVHPGVDQDSNSFPTWKGLQFVSGSGSPLAGSSAIHVAAHFQDVENCFFGAYDKPILYGANCYIMVHRRCLFTNNNYGVYFPSGLPNAGSTVWWKDCNFNQNVVQFHADMSSGYDLWWEGGSTSIASSLEVEVNGNGSNDNSSMLTINRVHFESDSALVSGAHQFGPRMSFNNEARVNLINCDFFENTPNLTSYITDNNNFCQLRFKGCRRNWAGYTPYMLANPAGSWAVADNCDARYHDGGFMVHWAYSGIANSAFSGGSMTGWTQVAPTAHVVADTDFPIGQALEVTGVGAQASMADNIILPAGKVSAIHFFAKNLDATNAASFLFQTGTLKGGALSTTQTITIPANTGRTHYVVFSTAGCFANFVLQATSAGGAVRFSDFYVNSF